LNQRFEDYCTWSVGTSTGKLEMDLAEKKGYSVEDGFASVGRSLNRDVLALRERLPKPVVDSNKRLLRLYTMQIFCVLIM